MPEPDRQRILDEEHLRLLAIGYWISGGVTAVFSLFGLLYVGMGMVFVVALGHAPGARGDQPPEFIGWAMAAFGGLFVLGGAALATLKFLTARALGRRRWHTLCLVTAAISCLSLPYGTFLGICTFMVLCRPSVGAMFGVRTRAPAPPPAAPGSPPSLPPGLPVGAEPQAQRASIP